MQIKNLATHANFVLDSGWISHGDAVIKLAREHNVLVVLKLLSENAGANEAMAVALAKANPDVVAGICLYTPYFSGYTPDAVAEFARRIKKSAPGISAWAAFVEKPRGKDQTFPVPPEIDVLVVNFYYDRTPQAVQLKASSCLRSWVQKAGGRPVILHWLTAAGEPPGIMAQTLPGTAQECAAIAKNMRLSGLILGHYGSNNGFAGIETNPAIQKEVKDVSESLRIRRSR